MLKIGFIGFGSIAKRHIRNLVDILEERGVTFNILLIRSGKGPDVSDEFNAIITSVLSIEQALAQEFDVLFITNPTAMHYNTLKLFSGSAHSFFIEKPVFNKSELNVDILGLKDDQIVYIACPLRYHPVIQFLKTDLIQNSRVYSVRAVSSSYLPDWRPGIDYRKCYSAQRADGGGVQIDLIHEWDYLTYLFGFPQNITACIGKYSDLEIDSDDLAVYIADYGSSMIELHLDYFGRNPIRQIEIFAKNDTIIADLLSSRIDFLRTGKRIQFNKDRDAYQKSELDSFLNIIDGKQKNHNNIQTALKVLKLTEGKLS